MRNRGWAARSVLLVMGVAGIGTGMLDARTAVGTDFTYQGRLEDGQAPANGSYDFKFRLYDAVSAGSQHGPTVTVSALAVADGWVTVELDFGSVFNGDERWLEIAVRPAGGGTYTTLSPRRELTAAPNALWAVAAAHAATADAAATAQQLGGHAAGDFLDTSSSLQVKEGRLVVGNSAGSALSYGLEAYGGDGGGRFATLDGSAVAMLAQAATGVLAEGDIRGAYFENDAGSGTASLAIGNRGIEAAGTEMGGYFEDSDGTSMASVAETGCGIKAEGLGAGGRFDDSDGSGYAWVATGDTGIYARGNECGGLFGDRDSTGFALVASGDRGIEASGSEAGGYFENTSNGAEAWLATGAGFGGYFSSGDSLTLVASGDRGIEASATEVGGFFEDSDDTGIALIAYGDRGIQAWGSEYGGYFQDSNDLGYAYAGWSELGLRGFGDAAGGYFQDLTSSSYAYIGYGTYKVQGSGTVSFVQNHPWDDSKVVVYHAPEASEVAVYTRGSGRLEGGHATIALDPTFALVANPDLGLTAHLTARAPGADLHVASVSTSELVVEGAGEATFDYMVWGLRIGFEELAPVQPKAEEAYIPSMEDHRTLFAAEPELRDSTAFERFATTERELRGLPKHAALELDRAEALRAAIHEFDPAVDRVADRRVPLGDREPEDLAAEATADARPAGGRRGSAVGDDGRRPDGVAGAGSTQATALLPDIDGDLDARSLRTGRSELAVELPAVAGIAPGEVVALDPDTGLLVPAASSGDLRVVGIAAADPGVVLGSADDGDPTHTRVVLSGVASCRVDAGYGAVIPGDLLVGSPTPGHAMRANGDPLPGSVVAKALQPISEGQGTIRVLVWLR